VVFTSPSFFLIVILISISMPGKKPLVPEDAHVWVATIIYLLSPVLVLFVLAIISYVHFARD
jgi:hypothetical protein